MKMKETFKKIKENQKLLHFCNRIISYNTIFNDDTFKFMFLSSLISADCLTDTESCKETLEICNFILRNIDLFVFNDDKSKEDIITYLNKAIDIAYRDLDLFENAKKDKIDS